jgi:PAS domain S-box-containing protein
VLDALNSLAVLAANADLQDGNMAAFRDDAIRTVANQPGWKNVFLADLSGRQLVSTAADDVPSLSSVADLPHFQAVMATHAPYLASEIFKDPDTGRQQVAVALPVDRGAGFAYVLVAVLDPLALNSVFSRQQLGDGWVATVLDRNHCILARSRRAEELLGQRPPAELEAQFVGNDGTFDGSNREGEPSIGAYLRSDLTGWTLLLSAPKSAILASLSQSILLVLGGGVLFVVIGIVLSTRMGQHIERSTRSLLVPARRLASGQPLLTRPTAGLAEIELIGQEMDRAAALLEQRTRQQDAIGDLALKAVTAAERPEFFDEVLKVVTAILGVEFCDVLEYLPEENAFMLRAGKGWQPGRVGTTRIPNETDVLPGLAWAKGELVVYRDLASETRFGRTGLLQELGAVSGMAVPVQGPREPFGVLGIHSAHHREFSADEIDFVRAVANVVSAFLYRNATERQLAESERRVRHFVSSMNAVPYRYDVDAGRYTFVGPQSTRLLGFTPDEWGTVGWWARQMHPDDRDAAVAQEKILTERGEDYMLEYRMINKDGRVVWIRDIVRVEIAENGHKMLYGMATDITGAKEREQQLAEAEKLQAIGQLTGGVAHDFNNLLAIIIGTCELLTEQAQADPALVRTVAQITAAADRGAALTQRLLAFSRKQALRPSVVDVNALVQELEPLLARTLGTNITIRTKLAADLGRTLADASQLESVLVNLALNARDAMPDGGEVVIETRNASVDAQGDLWDDDLPPGYYVMLAVSDTGSGMTPEVKSRAFEPFFTTKPTGKGSGLGLSTVYGFVKQSGGSVTIYSEPGLGTTVRVYLPRIESGAAAAPSAPAPESCGCNETVLVVEDDPAVRNVVAGMVESLGYQVLEAESGADALALLEAGEAVDLVLTDVVMPGQIDGWKLAQSVWARWPGTRVLLTSGYSDNILVRHAALDERTQVLSKPYRRSELSQKLRALLDA